MIKAKDLIKKETVIHEKFYFKTKDNFELGNNNYSLKESCLAVAQILYIEKYNNCITDNITQIELEKLLDEREDKIAKLAARLEREFLNEEYSKPDLDENSALLTLYVDSDHAPHLENIVEATSLPYYMVKELEKDLYRWCRYEKLNKKSGFYKILACIDERDSDFGSTTVWYFEIRSYKPEVSNEN